MVDRKFKAPEPADEREPVSDDTSKGQYGGLKGLARAADAISKTRPTQAISIGRT